MMLLALLVGGATGALAEDALRPINCGGDDDGFVQHLTIDARIWIRENAGPVRHYRIRSRTVEGEGATARTLIRFRRGSFSYFDEYGCIRDPRLVLRGKAVETPLHCAFRGAPPCPPPR